MLPGSPPPLSNDAAFRGGRVAVCGSLAHLDPLLDGLCEALRDAGHAFDRLPSHHELLAQPALLAACDVIAGFGNMPISAQVMDRAPRLRGVVSCVSGTDGFDLDAASARAIIVAHAPTEENARSMAEAATLLLLQLLYDLDGTRDNLRHDRPRPNPVRARMLNGKTVGLVGWGRIAQIVASLLQPWGVELLVSSRRGTGVDVPAHARAVELDTLLERSDAVCVLAGAEANAPPLVDRAGLARMKSDAFLINLSRGSNVDEPALVEALRERRIAGAALDVFATEPLPLDSPLRQLPHVILTPHHVGHTREGDASLLPALVENVLALLRGQVPPMVRNRAAVDAWQARWGRQALVPATTGASR
ncbi:NAD(P)-dependent oxidoreductase [Ramlibacter aurantiacus]|uniref:NAD(P)-dependent oxidoreductase n=1 Tax=Ramlibacter aurantiacus TaxID=2801330 RepID=UPI001918560C|nr:NAD(P)-dependent oxidoreductase [Ramlibacter aurantiacus]